MDTIFILLFLVSSFAIFIFAILALINIKKDKTKAKKHLKSTVTSTVLSLVTLIGFIATADKVEPTEQTAPVAEADKSKEPVKSDAESKAETDAKAAAEEKEKADKLTAEKEYFLNEVEQKVNEQLSMYDTVWNELWVSSFNGVGDGSMSVYTAYDNAKKLEDYYNSLSISIGKIEATKLSEENEKLFKEFQSKMKDAALWRGMAAEKAQKMFDSRDVSPSKLNELKEDVSYADNQMMLAAIALTSLKMELGLIEETEETPN